MGRIYRWQVEHEGRAHNIMAGDEKWDEDNCPLCVFDGIVGDLSKFDQKEDADESE